MVIDETIPRRNFLIAAAGMLAASALPHPALAKGIASAWPLGVQLWSVQKELKADTPGTLKAIKAAGYDVVETAGLAGLTPKAFRALLDANGLKCRSAHRQIDDFIDRLEPTIEETLALGAEFLICPAPLPPAPLPPKADWVTAIALAMTADAWKTTAEHLAKASAVVKKAGLTLGYHNHIGEFKDLGGFCGYDVIVKQGGADLRLEMDLGWVKAAGRDPVQTMKTYGDRLDLLHVKDMIQDPAEPTGYRSVEIGQGLLRWPEIFETAKTLGVKGYFVEQEEPYKRPILESLVMSTTYLRQL